MNDAIDMVASCDLYKDCDECTHQNLCNLFTHIVSLSPYQFKQELLKDDRVDKGKS